MTGWSAYLFKSSSTGHGSFRVLDGLARTQHTSDKLCRTHWLMYINWNTQARRGCCTKRYVLNYATNHNQSQLLKHKVLEPDLRGCDTCCTSHLYKWLSACAEHTQPCATVRFDPHMLLTSFEDCVNTPRETRAHTGKTGFMIEVLVLDEFMNPATCPAGSLGLCTTACTLLLSLARFAADRRHCSCMAAPLISGARSC